MRVRIKEELDEKSYAKCALEVHDETRLEKVLGLPWNCETDTFHFNLAQVADRATGLIPTKRNILSVLAAMYNPLGIVSPISVTIKVLFQEICVAGLDWDIEIHDKMKEKWHAWLNDLNLVKEIIINRCLYGSIDKAQNCTLHEFSDAIYFVCELNGYIQVELLTSKTRIAPLKTQTIPRLELMSAINLGKIDVYSRKGNDA